MGVAATGGGGPPLSAKGSPGNSCRPSGGRRLFEQTERSPGRPELNRGQCRKVLRRGVGLHVEPGEVGLNALAELGQHPPRPVGEARDAFPEERSAAGYSGLSGGESGVSSAPGFEWKIRFHSSSNACRLFCAARIKRNWTFSNSSTGGSGSFFGKSGIG
jgi:hypothetical protein